MITITGSNRAGVAVAKAAADTVKRVTQELGGKSAAILLDDVDISQAAKELTLRTMRNSGQSCAALTRLLVPAGSQDAAIEGARAAVAEIVVGDPASDATTMGPIANRAQFERVKAWIAVGAEEGARVVAGGPGRPPGLETGFYVRPTVFADVRETMSIAQEEIFGPVLCIMPYRDEADAIRIANATKYGLSGAVRSADHARAMRVASRLRTGMVHVNQTSPDYGAPFGGYRQSGNGREWGTYGLEEYLETKVIFGSA
jgi:aldehyde dehydrogenase (NAD+)